MEWTNNPDAIISIGLLIFTMIMGYLTRGYPLDEEKVKDLDSKR